MAAGASEEGQLKLAVPEAGEVSALWLRPVSARWLLVLAHGAGAGMNHPFLGKLAAELASVEIATFRYQFPYMEQRRRLPDSAPVLKSTVRAAVKAAGETAPDLPILAGGKSMGGRMTSQAAADHPPEFEKSAGFGLLRLSAASSRQPGHEACGPFGPGPDAHALPSRHPRSIRRPGAAAPDLCKPGRKGNPARNRNGRPLISRFEKFGKDRCGSYARVGAIRSLLGRRALRKRRCAPRLESYYFNRPQQTGCAFCASLRSSPVPRLGAQSVRGMATRLRSPCPRDSRI